MSIVSVPLTALTSTTLSAHPASRRVDSPATTALVDNDRKALHLTAPWHAEILTHARTGEVLLTPCDCMLERDHSYAERMSWPAGLMQREA
ncbi:hypothetical protein [Gryllotalpicola koreensis]|uniref:Uncharacterized protein n=1 Tax=Gryllotalpicola koreensis TaxID=993086 RepID=A0ABP7ZT23_9MICO